MKKKSKNTRTPPKPRKERAPNASVETMVAAVARAEVEPDEVVAKEFGVSASAIAKWRARLLESMETAALLDQELKRLSSTWRTEAELTFIAVARDHRRRTLAGDILTLEQIGTAKTWAEANLVGSSMLGAHQPSTKSTAPTPPAAPASRKPPDDDEVRH